LESPGLIPSIFDVIKRNKRASIIFSFINHATKRRRRKRKSKKKKIHSFKNLPVIRNKWWDLKIVQYYYCYIVTSKNSPIISVLDSVDCSVSNYPMNYGKKTLISMQLSLSKQCCITL